MIAVCSSRSQLAKRKTYTLKELPQMPLAIRERGSGTLAALKAALEKQRIKLNSLNIKVKLGGTEALKNFLVQSDSLGFLPRRSVQKEIERGELAEIEFENFSIERSFYFVQRKTEDRGLNKSFIRLAKTIYNQ